MCLLTLCPYEIEDETWEDIYQNCEGQLYEGEFYLDTIASCLKMYTDFYRHSSYKPMDFCDYVADSLLEVKASYQNETFRLMD